MKLVAGRTESGDKYEGTEDAWRKYRQAWDEGNMDLVYFMEEGQDPEFQYAPELDR